MLSPLLVASLLAVSSSPPDSAIRVWLSSDGTFRPGERARVYVQPAEDGYLLVLRADADGRVRVIFPVDPDDDAFVHGGRKFEVRWRGDREAFYVEERPGSGTVVAAWSPDPFKFDGFVRNGHWDYRVFGATKLTDDAEGGLIDLATKMAGGTEIKADVAEYSVTIPPAWRDPLYGRGWFGGGWHSGVRMSFLFGSPLYGFGYAPYYYDPFCYDPFWGYDAFSCGYGFRYGFSYGGFYPVYRQPLIVRRPTLVGSFGGRLRTPTRFVMPRDRVMVRPVQPRPRASEGAGVRSRSPRSGARFAPPPRSSGRGSGRASGSTSRRGGSRH